MGTVTTDSVTTDSVPSAAPGLRTRRHDRWTAAPVAWSRRPVALHTVMTASDVLAPLLALAVVGAVLDTGGGATSSWRHIALFVGVTWGSFLVAGVCLRLHGAARQQLVPNSTDGLGRAVSAVVLGALLVLAADAVLTAPPNPALRPAHVLVGAAACTLALVTARFLVLAACCRQAPRRASILVLGTGTMAADIAGRLTRSRLVDFAGYVDDDPVDGQIVVGGLDELPTLCARHHIGRVVVAFSTAHPARMAASLRSLPPSVGVDIVSRYYDLAGWRARVRDVDGIAVLSLGALAGPAARAGKWVLDVVGAATVLVVALPVLGLAALGVRLTSPGPVIFRQTRLGRHRQPFEVLKFRTMEEPCLEGDKPRITPFGHILRRTGVDELPQLVNVLRRQMSLVGPRPLVPHECADLPDWAERRFDGRPGLTGLWQVCGQHALRLDELYRLDAQYLSGWSLWCDLRILAKTPGRLLRGDGDRDDCRNGTLLAGGGRPEGPAAGRAERSG